jgi:hypothetical protein
MAKYKQGDVLRSRTYGVVSIMSVRQDSSVESHVQYEVSQQLPKGERIVILGRDLVVDDAIDVSRLPMHISYARYEVAPKIKEADIVQMVATDTVQLTECGYFHKKTIVIEDEYNYIRNPTRSPMNSLLVVDDAIQKTYKVSLKDSTDNFETLYVINPSGEIFVATRALHVRMPHPTLLEVPDPEVIAGGLLKIKDSLLMSVDMASGHFKPGMMAIEVMLRAFSRLPESLYHQNFRGFFPYGAPALVPDFTQMRKRIQEAANKEKRAAYLDNKEPAVREAAMKKAKQRAAVQAGIMAERNPMPPRLEEFGDWMRGAYTRSKSIL